MGILLRRKSYFKIGFKYDLYDRKMDENMNQLGNFLEVMSTTGRTEVENDYVKDKQRCSEKNLCTRMKRPSILKVAKRNENGDNFVATDCKCAEIKAAKARPSVLRYPIQNDTESESENTPSQRYEGVASIKSADKKSMQDEIEVVEIHEERKSGNELDLLDINYSTMPSSSTFGVNAGYNRARSQSSFSLEQASHSNYGLVSYLKSSEQHRSDPEGSFWKNSADLPSFRPRGNSFDVVNMFPFPVSKDNIQNRHRGSEEDNSSTDSDYGESNLVLKDITHKPDEFVHFKSSSNDSLNQSVAGTSRNSSLGSLSLNRSLQEKELHEDVKRNTCPVPLIHLSLPGTSRQYEEQKSSTNRRKKLAISKSSTRFSCPEDNTKTTNDEDQGNKVQKKILKRSQNRGASTRYRLKKRAEFTALLHLEQELKDKNAHMRCTVESLSMKINYLKSCLTTVVHGNPTTTHPVL